MTPFLGWMTLSRVGAGMAFMLWAGSLPWILTDWGLSAAEAGLVQTSVNLSYAVSLLGSAWVADKVGAAPIFNLANWLAFGVFVLCALFARSLASALPLFSLLALMLGGGYAPSLMLAAQASTPQRRGAAVGWTLAGSSLGYFMVIALLGVMAPTSGLAGAWLLLAAAPLCSAVFGALAVRTASMRAHASAAPEVTGLGSGLRTAFFSRNSLLLTGGYAFHCWELLGMWAWAPAFLTLVMAGYGLEPVIIGVLAAAALHLSGAASTLVGGAASDRFGRRTVLVVVALAGAACSFFFGWTGSFGVIVLVIAASLYGFTALGDSGVLSAAMADATPPHLLGRVLALRSISGFGAGALAPLAFGAVLDFTNPGEGPFETWGWAFALLGLGGVGAAICATLLPRGVRIREENR
jgi:MFS family permease